MADITILGPMINVLRKMRELEFIVGFRKDNGWEPLMNDEQWDYETQRDDNVCDVCKYFEYESGARSGLNAIDIKSQLPDQKPRTYAHPTLFTPRWPNTHTTYPELEGTCRCNMDWIEPVKTLKDRLLREMKEFANV